MASAIATPETELVTALLERVGELRRGLRRATPAAWPGGSLTGAQIDLVRLLRREPGLPVAEAAARLRLKANTVSTLVGQLTRAGVVERERDPEDGRVTRLALTPSALEWLKAWRDERAATLLDAVDRLGPADRRALHAALGPLERLTAELHDGGAHGR